MATLINTKLVRKVNAPVVAPEQVKIVKDTTPVQQKPVAKKLEATTVTQFVDVHGEISPIEGKKGKFLTKVEVVRHKDKKVVCTATLVGGWDKDQASREYYKLLDGKLPEAAAKNWKFAKGVCGVKETTTYVGIWLGDMIVAEADVPGYLLPEDALEDFRENPDKYTRKFPGADMAWSMGLIK